MSSHAWTKKVVLVLALLTLASCDEPIGPAMAVAVR